MASSLFRRSLVFLLAAVLAASLVFSTAGLLVLGGVNYRANESSLVRAALTLAAVCPPSASLPEAAASFVRSAAAGGYRVTLIDATGTVIADSEADPRSMENHASRAEVAAALGIGRPGGGRASSSHRKSATLGVNFLYAAAPLAGGGVLRLALHEPGLEQALVPARWTFALAALAFIAAAIGAAAAFSRMMGRPLAALGEAARSYGRGEEPPLSAAMRALGPGAPAEISLLAATLDSMATEIGERMLAAKAQGAELEAILDAIAEAVLALDAGLRIRRANPAAARLFGLADRHQGIGLLEATRSSSLQEAAAACLSSREDSSAELSLYLPGERFFQAFMAPLAGGAWASQGGVVIVLNEITELRRLERVRRDFVANVSHELRTPVQMVKGFAEALGETLEEGSFEDPERGGRFLGIIAKNAARMESLISDLLSLASLEREGREWLKAEKRDIAAILEAAAEAVGPRAEARGSELRIDCEEGLTAQVDAGLVEQALINLLDNALKYSPPASLVRTWARREGSSLVIEVKDEGMGIPAKDLPRIFERFYRVDRARSRELGGTGLGLAIVKHIALAHGGGVSVESWEGEGSTFRLRLPLG
jgi:two-component system, OmpR family, phosphate regulon sensor histidine kinase PhoR